MRCGLKPLSLPDRADEMIEVQKIPAMHESLVGSFSNVAGSTDDVDAWGKADSSPT
jgi:hypothetical protein